jgi:predicted CXXCH cytochrome family protein
VAALRQTMVISALLAAAAVVGWACAPQARYRVLRFFFDGVPEPGAPPRLPGYPAEPGRGEERGGPAGAESKLIPRTVYAHAPYKEDRCGACHSPQTGELSRSVQAGLCRSCHPGVPGPAPYVHGPVAVSDCLFCHHYHYSVYPKLLLSEATALCLRCHEGADLTAEAHPEPVLRRTCVECHNPHGGENRFFLKRTER